MNNLNVTEYLKTDISIEDENNVEYASEAGMDYDSATSPYDYQQFQGMHEQYFYPYLIDDEDENITYRTWFVIVLLIIFPPAGLFFMWKRDKFNKIAKILLTAGFIVFFAAICCGGIMIKNEYIKIPQLSFSNAATAGDSKNIAEGNAWKLIETDYDNKAVDNLLNGTVHRDKPSNNKEEKAIEMAEDIMFLSKSQLMEYLMDSGLNEEDAIYAADNLGISWSEQARIRAERYLVNEAYAAKELKKLLIEDGFTQEQVQYAVENTLENTNE